MKRIGFSLSLVIMVAIAFSTLGCQRIMTDTAGIEDPNREIGYNGPAYTVQLNINKSPAAELR